MKKAFLLVLILFVSVMSTACINNLAVQELNNKAKTALDSGDYQTAINRLKSSIDLDGTIFETHYNLGIAYTQAEEYPEAVETFKNAEKLRPNFADTYYSLGVAQENYAKGIIDGSIKKSAKGIYETVKAAGADGSDQNSGGMTLPSKVKLSKTDKKQIANLFNDAVESYSIYLEKGKNENDKADVQDKINYLKAQIQKYAPEKFPNQTADSSQTESSDYVR